MAILRFDGVRREIGDFVILDSVSAAVAHGERIGLVGANGSGKTSLLRLAAGRDEPDTGKVHRKSGLRIGLLAQETNLDAEFRSTPSLRAAVRGGASPPPPQAWGARPGAARAPWRGWRAVCTSWKRAARLPSNRRNTRVFART